MDRRGALVALFGAVVAPWLKRFGLFDKPVPTAWRPLFTGRIDSADRGDVQAIVRRYHYLDYEWTQWPKV